MTETSGKVPSDAGPAALAWRRFRSNRPAYIALIVLAWLVALVATSPLWWKWSPETLHEETFARPSARHWLGTDANGRDMVARVCAGARVSLVVGLAGAAFSLCIGVFIGGVAGYVGGRGDALLMRGVDLVYSLPSVILVMVLMAAFRDPVTAMLRPWLGTAGERWASAGVVVVGLGAVSWLSMARVVRGQVRTLRRLPFVEAGHALGLSHGRQLWRHILPNTSGVILVALTLTVPTVVLGESFLSFLGLGIQPPAASLGSLLADGAGQINPVRTYWWLLLGPAAMLVTLLLGVGYVGDGLRDALDPKSQARANGADPIRTRGG